jgi:hypothetical protein
MDDKFASLPWLPELMDQIEQALERLSADQPDCRLALEHELQQIDDSFLGLRESLKKSTLAAEIRTALEEDWAAALERKQEIEDALHETNYAKLRNEGLVQPEQVLQRLECLDKVLTNNDPTRGNLELSLHIDRITCYPGGKVTMRTCKLGTLTDAVELLSDNPAAGDRDTTSAPGRDKARRRSRLRTDDADDGARELRAMANFAADPDRFAGLGSEWFWIDEFQLPDGPESWAATNGEAVFKRRQETKFSYAKLAVEFGVTPPTIGAAIRTFLEHHPGVKDEVQLPRGGKRPKRFDPSQFGDEARELWLSGWTKKELAAKYGCSVPTLDSALAFVYERDGLPFPKRQPARAAKSLGEADRSPSSDQPGTPGENDPGTSAAA